MTSVRHNARLTLEFVMWLGKRPNIVCKEEGGECKVVFLEARGIGLRNAVQRLCIYVVCLPFVHASPLPIISLLISGFILEEYFGSNSSMIENMDSSCSFSLEDNVFNTC